MGSKEQSSATLTAARKKNPEKTRSWWKTQAASYPSVRYGRDGRTQFDSLLATQRCATIHLYADVCSEFVKSEDWNRRADGTRKRWDKNVIGVLRRPTDGWRTVDRPPTSIPPLPFAGARVQGARITQQDIDEFGATEGCPGRNEIKDNKRAQAHSDCRRVRIEECLRVTQEGAERLDRRSQQIYEELAEEVKSMDQKKERGSRATPAAS